MRTLFEFGWTPMRAHWSGAHLTLGQEGGGATLMQENRDRIVNLISSAVAKVRLLDDLIAWSVDNDPQLKRTLGQDYTRFWALSNSIAQVFPAVREVLVRMSDPDPEFWIAPTPAEEAVVRQWTTGVDEMTRIVEAHRKAPVQVPPGMTPPSGFRPAAAPPTAAARAAPPPAEGPSMTEILVGGGVAVALGLLIFAVVS